ncbi:MAG: TetR/AcrR family transcriptional regulator [Dethiobacteria bacterium]
MSKSADSASSKKTRRKRPRRYLRSRITRNLILETAQKVFLTDGYSKTTIAKISEMANVGYGTVYSHFKGKDDILGRVVDNVLEEFYALLNIEFAPTNVKEARDIFHNIMLSVFKLSEQHRPIMKVYQQALGQSEAIVAHWQRVQDYFIKNTKVSIIFSQKKGFAKQFDAVIGSRAYILLVDRFIWEVVNGKVDNVEHLADVLTDMVFQGFFN